MALKTHSKSAKESKGRNHSQAPFRKKTQTHQRKGLGSRVCHSHLLPSPCRYKLEIITGSLSSPETLFRISITQDLSPSQNTLTLTRECTCMKQYTLIPKCRSVEGMSSDNKRSSPFHSPLNRSSMPFSISNLPLS